MTGLVTVSVELELGWGRHDEKEYSHLSSNREEEDEYLDRFLDLCDTENIPVSFNIVGHLLHDSCSGTHRGPYTDGWWDEDPGSDLADDPLFYAPKMVESIRDREVDHEICTHTYSHIYCDETTEEVLDHELQRVEEVHSDAGLATPTSIVPPRHNQPSYQVLRDHGIEVVRRPLEDYAPPLDSRIAKFLWFLTRSHPVGTIEIRDDVVETRCTPHPSLTNLLLSKGQEGPPHTVFRGIPHRIRRYLHKKYLINAIDTAAATGGHLHLWTHVFDFSNESQWSGVRDGLQYLGRTRDEGKVSISTMADLPKHIE